jgi:NADH-quinone oxidoreductase subunit L
MLSLGPAYTVLVNKYYLDDLYLKGIVRPIQYAIAQGVYWTNQNMLDGLVNAAGWVARKIALGVDQADRRGVDGAVNGVAFGAGFSGGILKYIQSGNVQRYAAVLFVGVGLLAVVITLIR